MSKFIIFWGKKGSMIFNQWWTKGARPQFDFLVKHGTVPFSCLELQFHSGKGHYEQIVNMQLKLCKGHHSKTTGHHSQLLAVIAVGYFKAFIFQRTVRSPSSPAAFRKGIRKIPLTLTLPSYAIILLDMQQILAGITVFHKQPPLCSVSNTYLGQDINNFNWIYPW